MNAILALENGTWFQGVSAGAPRVSGVTPRGLPSIITAAPVGRDSTIRIPVEAAAGRCPNVAGVAGRGAGAAAAVSRSSSEREGRARVSTTRRSSLMYPRRATEIVREPSSRSRNANGVTPRATPSTSTLAPPGVVRTNKRPTFAGAGGAGAAGETGWAGPPSRPDAATAWSRRSSPDSGRAEADASGATAPSVPGVAAPPS